MSAPWRITLCCLQPVLNAERDSEYYHLLGVDRKASLQAIKRAYHGMARVQHPDKRAQRGETVSDEDVAAFQRVKEAYECLSDGNRRRIYDAWGEIGLQLTENPATLSSEIIFKKIAKVSNRCRCAVLFFIFCCVGFVALYAPILFSLKVDGVTDVSWAAVFLPVWILDFLLLINALAWVYEGFIGNQNDGGAKSTDGRDEDAPNFEDHKPPNNHQGAPPDAESQSAGFSGAAYEEDDEPFATDDEGMPDVDDTPQILRILALIRVVLILCFQILLVIRLETGKLQLPAIFAPLLVREALALLEMIPGAFCVFIDMPDPELEDDALSATTPDSRPSVGAPPDAENGEETPLDPALERELRQVQQLQEIELRDSRRRTCRHLVLRIAFELLLLFKLDGPARTASWWIIFLPLWIEAAIHLERFFSICRTAHDIEKSMSNSTHSPMLSAHNELDDDEDRETKEADQLKAQAVATAQTNAIFSLASCFCLTLVAIFVVLRCINQREPLVPAALVFSPLFLMVCCCYCCTAGIICRFRSLDDLKFDEDDEDTEQGIAQSSEHNNTSAKPESSGTADTILLSNVNRHSVPDTSLQNDIEARSTNKQDDNNTTSENLNSVLAADTPANSQLLPPPPPGEVNNLEVTGALNALD